MVDNSYLPIWWLLLVIVIRIEVLKNFFNTSFLYKENPLLCKGVQKSFSVQYVKKPPFVNTLK